MPTALDELAQRIAVLEAALPELSRSSHLAYSSIDDGALTVTADGTVRAIIGQQPDGTTAVNMVNGPPPPAPTEPMASPVLGGVCVSWDGRFSGGSPVPLDFARVEVHTSPAAGFTPGPDTLATTIESPQGGAVTVPTVAPLWVALATRSTSGRASMPSRQTTAGPAKVVADSVLAGIITELALADDAVTAAKVAAGAINSDAIADAAVTATKLGQAAVVAGKLAADAVTPGSVAAGAISTRELTAGSVTTTELAAGAVNTAQLAAGAVTAGQIAAGAITATLLAAGSVTATKVGANAIGAGKIAADTVTGREIKALSITVDKLAVNSITAAQLAAGAVTADVLAVGTVNNYIPDGSFEGPVGAARAAAGSPYWSIASGGCGSAKSLRVDATAAPAASRSLPLATVTVRPGDQLVLRYDYQASPDWQGGAIKFYAKWLDAAGAIVAFNSAQVTAPVLGPTWQAATATVTAPPGTATAVLVVESWLSTAGQVYFDNVEAKPVLGQVQIADGTVTAAKLSADAINGKTITGATVTGGTVQTGAAGARIVLNPSVAWDGEAHSPALLMYTGASSEKGPASITVDTTAGMAMIQGNSYGFGSPYFTLSGGRSSDDVGRIQMGGSGSGSPSVSIGGLERRIDLVVQPPGATSPTRFSFGKELSIDGWQPLVLASGFSAFGSSFRPPQLRRLPDGRCTVRGVVKIPSGFTGGKVATLPDGYRPSAHEVLELLNETGTKANLTVYMDGTLGVTHVSGPLGGWISFGSATWGAD
ncbi:hypothetical protein AB0D10_01125 [Kitasatospora sp. NPDC048545]|uniref:hypothetical protein n=1 Tax=Kitasatospora sp. NPDC048545 TaxID=3157208 RepID=UPI00340CE745